MKANRDSEAHSNRRSVPKWLVWGGIVFGILMVIVLVSLPILEERLRETVEERANDASDRYSVRVPELDISILGRAVALRDVVVMYKDRQETPSLEIARVRVRVALRELFRGRLSIDLVIDRPVIEVTLDQIMAELEDDEAIDEPDWQEVLGEIDFLVLNLVEVNDGSLTYLKNDESQPLRVTNLKIQVEDIGFRVKDLDEGTDEDSTLRSPFEIEATVFGEGRFEMKGRVNILANSHPAVAARFSADSFPLGPLEPPTRLGSF